jgi:hypothetical protein
MKKVFHITITFVQLGLDALGFIEQRSVIAKNLFVFDKLHFGGRWSHF